MYHNRFINYDNHNKDSIFPSVGNVSDPVYPALSRGETGHGPSHVSVSFTRGESPSTIVDRRKLRVSVAGTSLRCVPVSVAQAVTGPTLTVGRVERRLVDTPVAGTPVGTSGVVERPSTGHRRPRPPPDPLRLGVCRDSRVRVTVVSAFVHPRVPPRRRDLPRHPFPPGSGRG